jgi:hypothetical protein
LLSRWSARATSCVLAVTSHAVRCAALVSMVCERGCRVVDGLGAGFVAGVGVGIEAAAVAAAGRAVVGCSGDASSRRGASLVGLVGLGALDVSSEGDVCCWPPGVDASRLCATATPGEVGACFLAGHVAGRRPTVRCEVSTRVRWWARPGWPSSMSCDPVFGGRQRGRGLRSS